MPPFPRDQIGRWLSRCACGAFWLLLTGAQANAGQIGDLTTLSLEQLLEVPVVGASKYEQNQRDVAASVSVITSREIEAFGWRTLDQALASLPGIHTTYDRQYAYLGTRGFGLPGDFNTRILLTIDGNRVNDAIFDQAYIGQDFPLDMRAVERIEFIPGPGGAVYGQNAMFGVVNVITRRGASVHGGELTLSTQHPQGAWDSRALWGERFANGVEAFAAGSVLSAHGRNLLVDFGKGGSSGIAAGLDGERDAQVFAGLTGGAWSFNISYGDRRKDDPLGTYLSDPLTPDQYQRDRHLLAQAEFQRSYANGARHLSARVFAGSARYTAPFTFEGEATEQTGASNWEGAETRILLTGRPGHKLLVGADYQANSRQDQSFNDFTTPANSADIPGAGWRAGVFAQDEWTLHPRLSATIGLRANSNDSIGNAWSPRAGLIWRTTHRTGWKLLYGRAHRAPNAFERDFSYVNQVANPALNGETIDTVEVVVDHRLGEDLTLRAALYQWTMRDLIVLGADPQTGTAQYQSGDLVHARGMEFSADKTWRSNARLRGSLSFQDVTDANELGLPNSPGVLGKLNLSAPLPGPRLELAYELQYDSGRSSLDGTALKGYALSNLNVRTSALPRHFELSVTVRNLFDAVFQTPGSRNNWQNALDQDGRSIRLTLSAAF